MFSFWGRDILALRQHNTLNPAVDPVLKADSK